MDVYFIQQIFLHNPSYFCITKTNMPAAQWTTKAQYEWLQEHLPEYIQHSTRDKDYSCFWPKIHKYWFKTWPERDILFPNIPDKVPLTVEQMQLEVKAQDQCKTQLLTWFHWQTNMSKKNRSLKKEQTVFDAVLLPKTFKAEQEAGNVTTSGHRMVLGQKFSKELLEDELDEIKKEVRERYDKQIKGSKGNRNILDDKDNNDDESDPDVIAKGIDELPIICQRFARLIKKKLNSLCPSCVLDLTQGVIRTCHPSETSAGRNFAHFYPDEDYAFLDAYQQFAESIFSMKKHDPLLPATMDVGDDNRSEELEDDASGEEDKSGEENKGGTDTMSWNNPSLYMVSQMPDASMAPNAPMMTDASMTGTMADFSDASLAPAGFIDASLQFTGPNQGASYSQSQYSDWSLDFTMQNASFSSPASSGLWLTDTMQGATAEPNMHAWNFNNGDLNLTGWETHSLSSLLTSLPTLPAANPPSPTETVQPAEVPNLQAGTGCAQSKCKSTAPEVIIDTPTVTVAATTVKLTPLVNSTEPTPVILPANTAKPKAKPKHKPKAMKSSAVTETVHIAVDEGNTLGDSIMINNVMQKLLQVRLEQHVY
ncbi:hypothetical protein DFH29DRAFT_1001724 [Suillus ampliporus]|nr:hypothetical protein DFH29DRAFT_1001724 [Suillus ampliporus]